MESTSILGYFGALVIGFVLGLIGGGGSTLTVPILVYLLGYNPIIATAYSLFVVGTTSLVGTITKYNKGLVDIKTGLAFCFPSFLAVYITRRYLLTSIPDVLFSSGNFIITKSMSIMVFFAAIMVIASISMIKNKTNNINITPKQPYYKTFIQGLIIGTITGLIGAGGGFLYVPALVLWSKIPIKKAVGTSLIIVTINSLIGFLGDVQTITIQWEFLVIFTLISIIGIFLGTYLSKYISSTKLKKAFGIFILLMAVFIMIKEIQLT